MIALGTAFTLLLIAIGDADTILNGTVTKYDDGERPFLRKPVGGTNQSLFVRAQNNNSSPIVNQTVNQTANQDVSSINSVENVTDFMIFQIGFHKCGTRTTAAFFLKNDVPSVHFSNFNGFHNGSEMFGAGRLPLVMQRNLDAGRPIMDQLSDKYVFYSDYGVRPQGVRTPWYQLIAEQYPGTKFLLQIRSLNSWLYSRFNHINTKNGFFIDRALEVCDRVQSANGTIYRLKDVDLETRHILVLQSWISDWYGFMCQALEYFERTDAMDNLLIFDIEKDDISKMISFFESFGMSLQGKYYRHIGKTNPPQSLSSSQRNQSFEEMNVQQRRKWHLVEAKESWNSMAAKMPQFFGNLTAFDGFESEEERIKHRCAAPPVVNDTLLFCNGGDLFSYLGGG